MVDGNGFHVHPLDTGLVVELRVRLSPARRKGKPHPFAGGSSTMPRQHVRVGSGRAALRWAYREGRGHCAEHQIEIFDVLPLSRKL